MTLKTVTVDTLDSAVAFDCPFTVLHGNRDGVFVIDPIMPNVYAPEPVRGEDDNAPDGWEWASDGYTGQYGYNGPHLHNSETLSGGLARDILATPGVYVVCAVEWECDHGPNDMYVEDCQENHAEGWVVLRLTENDASS